MKTLVAVLFAAVVVALSSGTVPQPAQQPVQPQQLVIPATLDLNDLPQPKLEENEARTLDLFYPICGPTTNCTDTTRYCGWELLSGWRCRPKQCIGFCASSDQCLTGACVLSLCQSCIGK